MDAVLLENVPGRQGMHCALPGIGAWVPGAHGVKLDRLVSGTYPGLAKEQLTPPSRLWNVPLGHMVHKAEPLLFANVPGLHSTSSVKSSFTVLPGLAGMQSSAPPGGGAKVPDMHSAHSAFPREAEYEPGLQGSSAVR